MISTTLTPCCPMAEESRHPSCPRHFRATAPGHFHHHSSKATGLGAVHRLQLSKSSALVNVDGIFHGFW